MFFKRVEVKVTERKVMWKANLPDWNRNMQNFIQVVNTEHGNHFL